MANRPNFFVALQIKDRNVIEEIGNFRKSVLDRNPVYRDSFIPTGKLHVTLCVMNLRDQDEIDTCAEVLDRLSPVLSSKIGDDRIVHVQGVGHFERQTSVIYAKCHYPKRVVDMVKYLRWRLGSEGVNMCWSGSLPHLTIMKLTGSVRRDTGIEKFDSWIYQNKEDINFGNQLCDNIRLYKMKHGNQVDYQCFYEADL